MIARRPFWIPAMLLAALAWTTGGAAVGAASTTLTYTDITRRAGIRFEHNNGAFGKKYLPETMGSGCAFVDFDNDGWQDIVLINSSNFPGHPGPKSYPALYRNNHDGTFTDVTRKAGLAVEMYGLGVAVGDYDNDGYDDLYVTALGTNHLFHNTGHGTFTDATAHAGVADPGFSTSAAWFDYDNDGRLDLFVGHYVQWSPQTDLYCTLDGKSKSYCTPESYKGQSATLFRNEGNGTFEDVTKKAGLYDPSSKALGVALIDYDNDGHLDLFVANDTQPNKLYRNKGDGTFVDVGMTAGVAFNEAGVARAGMGVDAADYDGSGRQSLVIGNFSNEMMALYENDGHGLFIDEAPRSGIGRPSLLTLTFGCFFYDADLDGLLDIFAANGHVADDINHVQQKVTYAEPAHLFRDLGKRRFEEITSQTGAALQQPVVARGAAYGDVDNDGDLDLLETTNRGPARLLRNDGGNANHMVRIRTVGTTSNRDGIGAKVRLTLSDGRRPWAMVKSGSSFCSQSELPLTFGLGAAAKVTAIEIDWPSGHVDKLPGVDANRSLSIQEGKGIVSNAPIATHAS
ncbi:MAG TPA: CRTAC1 family protein [Vicinamibacterales bacterium]|nr:CRTAC1 family protein [Vicinamibacterales bacterium]